MKLFSDNHRLRLEWTLYGILAVSVVGCGFDPACPHDGEGPVVVLTFDDGPLPADVADLAENAGDPKALLDPLRQILAVLEQEGARAVFFVAGPGSQEAADPLAPVYAEALTAIHDSGHILGYHAFSHDPNTWLEPLNFPGIVEAKMAVDLDRLQAFIDKALALTGYTQDEIFSPLFRQPYLGGGVLWRLGRYVANERGWVYRGVDIDSVDWTANADVPSFVESALPVATEEEHVDYVLSRLRDGVSRRGHREPTDVLFHLNHFTAAHLVEWIDALRAAFADAGYDKVIFDVPPCYTQHDDLFLDLSVAADVLWGL
jgi:peptidoglycan/xylan/chitin deacetylase (PgdA/CDA1 family)